MLKRKTKPLILTDVDPSFTGKFLAKEDCEAELEQLADDLYNKLYLMFADNKYALLIILQGIDASGKDGVIRHVFSCANPQGLSVKSFKKPNEEELRHDFIWRCHRHTPSAGSAVIFNRSYYEEVTTVKVHPDLLKYQHLPDELLAGSNIVKNRYRQINDFERMLFENGTLVVKFLLHVSKDEQRVRLRDRVKDRSKNWKFSAADVEERKFWDEYMDAFQLMVDATNTKAAPWHVIPANAKWYRNYLVSKILVDRLSQLPMKFPKTKIPIQANSIR